jgi:hypothetical protein
MNQISTSPTRRGREETRWSLLRAGLPSNCSILPPAGGVIVRGDPLHWSVAVIDLKLVQGLWSVEYVRAVIQGLRRFLRQASTVKIDHRYPKTQDDEGQRNHGHHAPCQVHYQPVK